MSNQVIGHRAIRHRKTGIVVTSPSPIYEDDYPYRDVEPGQLLFKYMSFWKFQDLIHTGQMYFRRSDKFIDPLEGTLSIWGVDGTSESDKARVGFGKHSSQEYQTKVEEHNPSRAAHFVCCWNIANEPQKRMWDEYTEDGDSLAVVTTRNHLARGLLSPVVMSAVKYLPTLTAKTSFDEHSLFFYKDQSFEFEREFRLLVDQQSAPDIAGNDDDSRRIPVNLNDLIQGIAFHPFATEDFKSKVQLLIAAA